MLQWEVDDEYGQHMLKTLSGNFGTVSNDHGDLWAAHLFDMNNNMVKKMVCTGPGSGKVWVEEGLWNMRTSLEEMEWICLG